MERKDDHNIYGINRHGKRELPIEATGLDGGDPNLAGGMENAEAIEDFISDGIHEALLAGSNIDQGAARTIARALVHALGDDAPGLDAFARTGEGERRRIEQEYFLLNGDDNIPDIVREWINWLGNYLLWRDFPELPLPSRIPEDAAELPGKLVADNILISGELVRLHRPASITDLRRDLTATRLAPLLAENGDALRSYLTLPDVDASGDELIDDFRTNFTAVYEDIDETITNLTEISDWERDLQAWARERGLLDLVHIDRHEIEKITRDIWDIVELGGRCYVFDR